MSSPTKPSIRLSPIVRCLYSRRETLAVSSKETAVLNWQLATDSSLRRRYNTSVGSESKSSCTNMRLPWHRQLTRRSTFKLRSQSPYYVPCLLFHVEVCSSRINAASIPRASQLSLQTASRHARIYMDRFISHLLITSQPQNSSLLTLPRPFSTFHYLIFSSTAQHSTVQHSNDS